MRRSTSYAIPISAPQSMPGGGFRKALQVWLDAKGEAELPPVSSIDPLKIPKEILPDMAIIAVEDGPKKLFVRLVGERIKLAVGSNHTNRWGEDVEGGEDVLRIYLDCIERRAPIYCEGPMHWSINDFRTYRSVLLPYAAPDGRVRKILTYLEFS